MATSKFNDIPFYGALIRVLPGCFGPSVWRGELTIVRNEPVPEWARPFPLMQEGWRGHWSLCNGKKHSRPIKALKAAALAEEA